MKQIIVIAMALALVSGFLSAQEDITKHPGFIDLSGIQIPDNAGEVTEVTIGPEIFGLINAFAPDSAKKAMPAGGLFSINVKTFEIDQASSEKVRVEMNKIEKKLQKENWTSIVRVKSGDETTNVSVKFEKGSNKTLGFLVMSLEPGHEATFVNLVGSVPLEMLGNMGVNMNEDALDSLKQVMHGNKVQ